MNKIQKALQKLSDKERGVIKDVLECIQRANTAGLDVRRLRGAHNIFRIRKGRLRILYHVDSMGVVNILKIESRNENTYKL